MKSVCFTGHRTIKITRELKAALINVLRRLIENEGAVDFYAGGAVGWDTLCAQAVIALRRRYPHIRLRLVLPCCEAEQTAKWSAEQQADYKRILAAADSAEYTSEHYYNECMKARNARLVELADICVCYYNKSRPTSGTGQTVRMAEQKSIKIINLADF